MPHRWKLGLSICALVFAGCGSTGLRRVLDREMGVLCYLRGASGIYCLPVRVRELPRQQEANVRERGPSEPDSCSVADRTR